MAIKINVGVNKKIGLPDYGSAGGYGQLPPYFSYEI